MPCRNHLVERRLLIRKAFSKPSKQIFELRDMHRDKIFNISRTLNIYLYSCHATQQYYGSSGRNECTFKLKAHISSSTFFALKVFQDMRQFKLCTHIIDYDESLLHSIRLFLFSELL